MTQSQEKKLVNFDAMSKGAMLRYDVRSFNQALYKLGSASEEDMRAKVINHFLNTLEVDTAKLVEDIQAIHKDNNPENANTR